MSTQFGLLATNVAHEKLVDEDGDLHDYISRSVFEPIFYRGNGNGGYFLNAVATYLPDETRVYALDNTHQGIKTIGDIKEFLKRTE